MTVTALCNRYGGFGDDPFVFVPLDPNDAPVAFRA
jgi:hypothetical protein